MTESANQPVEFAGKTALLAGKTSSEDASTDTAVAGIKAIGTHTAADHRSTTADYTADYTTDYIGCILTRGNLPLRNLGHVFAYIVCQGYLCHQSQ